jgi:GNAT superfamily N-acetyltransferase
MTSEHVTIVAPEPGSLSGDQLHQVERIFFETASRTYEPGPARDAFRDRWLGRYLVDGDVVLLAVTDDGRVAGYLVGALENPAGQARFADMAYFRGDFRELCARFPAHLHINLTADFRSLGIGARLIEAFAVRAAAAGAGGMHVVTGKAQRNVRFYQRCGFTECGTTLSSGHELSFLGRELKRTAQ